MNEMLLRSVRPWGADTIDLRLRDGRIVEAGAALPAGPGAEVVDGAGLLALPGLVNAHAHLDKTLWGTPWHPHQAGPSVRSKIDTERRVLAGLGLSPEAQSARLLRPMLASGTTHIRTHVDVGPAIGLRHLHGLQRMREAHRHCMDIQIVAFPQMGVCSLPGTLDLLEQAARDGAEVIGGIDPMGIDRDPRGQLDGIFAIAERHGLGIDIHLHDAGEMGAVTVEMVAERVRALDMRGRVVISHAFCLGSVAPARLAALIELLLEQDIAIMSHGPGGGTPCPPVRELDRRGVRLFCGTDGVRDTWGPLNGVDMLERAFLVAYVNGLRDDDGLGLCLRMASSNGAAAMGHADHGLQPGCAADIVLLDVETSAEAVAAHPPRRLVIKRGRVLARDGVCLLPEPA